MDREGTRRVAGTVTPDPARLVMDANPPDGRRFWLTDEMLPRDRQGDVKPTFSIAGVAKVFFARSPDWLRWLNTQHKKEGSEEIFTLDGHPLEIKRTESGNRTWTLVDVERLAHALLQHGKIKVDAFVTTINIIRWMAFSYGMLSEADMLNAPPKPRIVEDAVAQAEQEVTPPTEGSADVIPIKEQAKAIVFSQTNEAHCEHCRVGECESCTSLAVCLCYAADPHGHDRMKVKHA